MRASLETGGVPVVLKYKPKRPRRPELYVLCDVSTSVTSASVFFLSVLHALHDSFRSMRSFVFVERISEVTDVFDRERDFKAVNDAISKDAGVADVSGYTDYGRVWREFLEQVEDDLHPRATVIVLGDARTNGRDPRADIFARVAERAGRTFWLNPEPQLYWNYGDSVISAYDAATARPTSAGRRASSRTSSRRSRGRCTRERHSLLRLCRGQGERQRLAVRARPQRVVGADRLPERDRHRVVGDRPAQVFSVVGAAVPPTGANAVPVPACSVCGSVNAPLTSLPVLVGLGSATDSVASPAVEMTFAAVVAVVVARHARRERAERRRRRRASATASPARCRPAPTSSPIWIRLRLSTASTLPAASTENHLNVVVLASTHSVSPGSRNSVCL